MGDSAVPQIAAHSVAKRTFQGAVAIGVRQIVVQGSRILGGIFLARMLTPGEFGFYAIILYFQTFLTAFGDAGLAASLVRQHHEPDDGEFRSIFTVQQLFVLTTSLALWFAAPVVAGWYHLSPHDAWMFRLVLLSFVATSFMVIPQVRMERHLAFDRLALIESTQAILFNVSAVYFAWRGLGGYSFAWALLLRSVVGAILANWISPWRIGWHWDWPIVRSHLSFGLAYQGIQVTSLLKDSITPVFIGILLGPADVGYVTWASIVAAYPVMALLVLQRLYLPAFARLQHHRTQLKALVENVIWATNVITAPFAVITLAMIVPLTTTVYGPKWLIALPYFYLLWPVNLVVASATPAMGLLNALGRSKVVLLFAVIWMAGTWIVGAPLIWLYGPIGFPISALAIQISAFWLFRAAKKLIPFRVVPIMAPTWLLASLSGLMLNLICRLRMPSTFLSITAYVCAGLLLYGSGLYLFSKQRIQAAWLLLRERE